MAKVLIFGDATNVYGFGRDAGAAKVASTLRMRGISCRVVDFFSDFTYSELCCILDLYVSTETLWVGFASTHFSNVMSAEAMLELQTTSNVRAMEYSQQSRLFPFEDVVMADLFSEIKRRSPRCKIVVGGFKAAHGQDFHGVDYWIMGDGENAALALTQALSGTSLDSLKASPARVGLAINGTRDYSSLQDFSESSLIWHSSDFLSQQEFIPIEIARGCAFRCKFCNYSHIGGGQYVRSMQSLKAEMIRNYELYGVTGYLYLDHMVNDSIEKVEGLASLASELPFEIEWSGFLRLDLIHKYPSMGELLLQSGLRSAQFGIESLNWTVLRSIGKGLHPDKLIQTLEALKLLWKGRVITGVGLIVGLPSDTWESIDQTISYFLSANSPVDSLIVSPLSIRNYDDRKSALGNYSDYSVQPEKYGMQMTKSGWVGANFNRQSTVDYVQKLYASDRFRKKKKYGDYHLYSRIRSLGFSHEQIADKAVADSDFIRSVSQRKQRAISTYKSHVLEGGGNSLVATPNGQFANANPGCI